MVLQFIYLYILIGMGFYFLFRKFIQYIINSDELFETLKDGLYEKTGFNINKILLWEIMNKPHIMLIYITFYPLVIFSILKSALFYLFNIKEGK